MQWVIMAPTPQVDDRSAPHSDRLKQHPAWLARLNLAPFRPRLLESLQDYDRERLWRDVGAGLTVGIVALPLAMAKTLSWVEVSPSIEIRWKLWSTALWSMR